VPDGVDTSSSGTVEQDFGAQEEEKTEISFEEIDDGDVDEGYVRKKGFPPHRYNHGSFGGP